MKWTTNIQQLNSVFGWICWHKRKHGFHTTLSSKNLTSYTIVTNKRRNHYSVVLK